MLVTSYQLNTNGIKYTKARTPLTKVFPPITMAHETKKTTFSKSKHVSVPFAGFKSVSFVLLLNLNFFEDFLFFST